ncbi:unnamed protein product [Closterium sp. NIES-54]
MAEIWMAGADYSTASYITHVCKGLPRSYNLMKRMTMVPGTWSPSTRTPSPTTSSKMRRYRRQNSPRRSVRRQVTLHRRSRIVSRSSAGSRAEVVAECWICHDPDHLSYECPERDDCDEDANKRGRGRSANRRPHRDAKLHKEKQTSKTTSSTKDVDNSSGKGRGDGESSCSMVGVVEPTVSLAPKAGEDFQAVAEAVQANPMAVLLDSGRSHHLMGTKAVFVDMAPSDGVKHVRGFNGALQPVEGRETVALQGEAGKRVLILDVLYVLGV